MYQYTNNSLPAFNKESSYHSLPDTYYQPTQPPQQHQNYGWYPQQSMGTVSAPMLANPSSPTDTMTANLPPLPTAPTETPPSPPHLNNNTTVHQPKITTSLWEDEGTICYQVDAQGICVARRQDNDMINGTKLLNVTGMSRGKRDGILKNEKGRVVVKVGAMHLKGVWVTFSRAMALAIQHNIKDLLHPLFVDDPSIYFYSNPMAPPHANYFIPTNQQVYMPQTSGAPPTSSTEEIYSPHRHSQQQQPSSATTPSSSVDYLPSARAVPSMSSLGQQQQQQDYYAFRESHNNSQQSVDHLDQQSLMDYASKGSSSMFSLTVSDSSPATPSQQSLFYDSTLSTVNSFPSSPHSTSIDYQSSQQQQFHQQRQHLQQITQQYQQQQPQQHHRKNSQSHMNNTVMMDLPIAPTLASNATLDSSFYYTHPCVSTTSFHDQQQQPSVSSTHLANPTITKLPPSSSSSSSFDQQQQHHQATMEFYGSYTQSPSTHYPMSASAQPW